MTETSKHPLFPVLRYQVDLVISVRNYISPQRVLVQKVTEVHKGFGMKYSTSNSLCISCSHLYLSKKLHATTWEIKISFYVSIKSHFQMPIEWDPVYPGALVLNRWSARHEKVILEMPGNTHTCSCAARRSVSVGRALPGNQCPIHFSV